MLRNFLLLVAASVGTVLVGCDSTPNGLPTSDAPEQVQDIFALPVGPTQVRLEWTAPSVAGSASAERYLIRFSPTVDFKEFDELTTPILKHPTTPGSDEAQIVGGLEPKTTYYFELISFSEAGLAAQPSPRVQATTLSGVDLIPPAPVGVSGHNSMINSISLEWVAVGDDSLMGRVSYYEIRMSSSAIDSGTWASANPIKTVPPSAAAGETQVALVENLPFRSGHYFAVRAFDEAGNVSGLLNDHFAQTLIAPTQFIVSHSGNDDCQSIQECIGIALDGDSVLVKSGDYHENIDFLGKKILLLSEQGPSITSIIGVEPRSPVILFNKGESREAEIRGFRITGGHGYPVGGQQLWGGGIHIQGASPSISGNHIVANGYTSGTINERTTAGGGIFCDTFYSGEVARPYVFRNIIEANASLLIGGGLYARIGSFPEVVENVFKDNSTGDDGGGMYQDNFNTGAATIIGNQFIGNIAGDHAGGLFLASSPTEPLSHALVRNNLFWRNSIRPSTREHIAGAGAYLLHVSGTVQQNTFVDNYVSSVGSACAGVAIVSSGHLIFVENVLALHATGSALGIFREGLPAIASNLFHNPFHPEFTGVNPDSIQRAGNVFVDPLFCDPLAGDFGPLPNSPATNNETGRIGAFDACRNVNLLYRPALWVVGGNAPQLFKWRLCR